MIDPAKKRARDRRHYAAHREARKAYSRRWSAAHPGYKRQWEAANPDKVEAYGRACALVRLLELERILAEREADQDSIRVSDLVAAGCSLDEATRRYTTWKRESAARPAPVLARWQRDLEAMASELTAQMRHDAVKWNTRVQTGNYTEVFRRRASALVTALVAS